MELHLYCYSITLFYIIKATSAITSVLHLMTGIGNTEATTGLIRLELDRISPAEFQCGLHMASERWSIAVEQS